MPKTVRNCFLLALGSNATSDVLANASIVGDALRKINTSSLKVERISQMWRTPAFPLGAGPDFANACAVATGDLTPDAVLDLVHGIEAELGRVRAVRWGQRVIDIDLVAAGDAVLPDRDGFLQWMALDPAAQAHLAPDRLILPHPRVQDRGFVLVPLAEVAPDWVHPVLGRSVRQMLAALDPAEIAAIRPI